MLPDRGFFAGLYCLLHLDRLEQKAKLYYGNYCCKTDFDLIRKIKALDELFFRAVETGKDISEYLPYVSDEGFHKLIEGCVNDKYDVNLDDIYPFLPGEEQKLLLKKLLNK